MCIGQSVGADFLTIRSRLDRMQCDFWISHVTGLVLEQRRASYQRIVLGINATGQITIFGCLLECA